MKRLFIVLCIVFLIIMCNSANSATLLGHWTGDNTPDDSSGNNNNGTLQNEATYTEGIAGNGFLFDGIDDHVRIEDSSTMNASTLTISAWVNPTAINTDFVQILTKWDNGLQAFSYALAINQYQEISFWLRIGNANRVEESNVLIPFNTFTHIAATYDGLDSRLYVNGTEVSTHFYNANSNATGYVNTSTAITGIGAQYGSYQANTPDRFFNGIIDDVRLYDGTLNSTDIQSLYNNVPEITSFLLLLLGLGTVFTAKKYYTV